MTSKLRDPSNPIYNAWKDMIRRCGGKNENYLDVSVCDDWLDFYKFQEWAEERYKEGLFIDKDIINPYSKEYSPENCEFVDRETNNFLTNHKKGRGMCPQGVSYKRNTGKFQAEIGGKKNRKYLGVYDTDIEAHHAYLKEKINRCVELSKRQESKRVSDGLLKHAQIMIKVLEDNQCLL